MYEVYTYHCPQSSFKLRKRSGQTRRAVYNTDQIIDSSHEINKWQENSCYPSPRIKCTGKKIPSSSLHTKSTVIWLTVFMAPLAVDWAQSTNYLTNCLWHTSFGDVSLRLFPFRPFSFRPVSNRRVPVRPMVALSSISPRVVYCYTIQSQTALWTFNYNHAVNNIKLKS